MLLGVTEIVLPSRACSYLARPDVLEPKCETKITASVQNTTQNTTQTHQRFQRTLFIWTKYNMQFLGVIPFIKLQIIPKMYMLCFVLINSVLLNLLCVWFWNKSRECKTDAQKKGREKEKKGWNFVLLLSRSLPSSALKIKSLPFLNAFWKMSQSAPIQTCHVSNSKCPVNMKLKRNSWITMARFLFFLSQGELILLPHALQEKSASEEMAVGAWWVHLISMLWIY